ncbi:MAG: response regulator [Bdellovibrionales bacterium]|nr:response regulator [Bdellovibrionales bacterium]
MQLIRESETLKILLIEDDNAHAKILSRTIQSGGHTNYIERATDGEEAFSLLNRLHHQGPLALPDIILLDLKLPKISGIEILRQLKDNKKFCFIPVIILTTSNAQKDKSLAYQLNANSYLVKPDNPNELKIMVSDLIKYWGTWNQTVELLNHRESHAN